MTHPFKDIDPDGLIPKEKEIIEYPENDIHFVIKHGEEIEQSRGYNQAIQQFHELGFEIDEDKLEFMIHKMTSWHGLENTSLFIPYNKDCHYCNDREWLKSIVQAIASAKGIIKLVRLNKGE